MTKEPVEILSDDEGVKVHDDSNEKRLVYKHKNGIVELHSNSLDCLQKGSYLKDDIVQFYFTYLVNEVCSSSMAARIHIFDSIFYDKIDKVFTDDKVERSKFKQLRKWYNELDIFQKDFLIFPVCYEDHWIVVVVCYAATVKPFDTSSDEEDADNRMEICDDLIPGLIIMDSLDLRGPKKVRISMAIRDFIDYNWRSADRPLKRFSHSDLKDYFPRLPKQTNHFDCGLYMLMYVKCFLENPDLYYSSIRDQGTSRIEPLSSKIKMAVEENDRETIKALIYKVCS